MWITCSTILLFCLVTIIVVIKGITPRFSDSYLYDVYYRDRIVCHGIASSGGMSLNFYGLSVLADKEKRFIAATSPVSLLVDGREYRIPELTPSVLKAIVGEGETIDEYLDDRNTTWINIDNSESRSLSGYKITCTFDGTKIIRFTISQNAQGEVESKYKIAIDGEICPVIPADREEMEKILGEAISIERQLKF